MKLLLIRHGDPDYTLDSLTEKGRREAAYLAERLSQTELGDIYLSPLGRAQDTAQDTLEQCHKTAVVCDWLREFHAPIRKPNQPDKDSIAWDWLPQDWTADERYFRYDQWYQTEIMQAGNVGQEYNRVAVGLDRLLEAHGYVRQGLLYQVVQANDSTMTFFCHFGVECVMLSHLLNVSPMILWHGFCAAPTSVTTLITEERRKGIAAFRISAFGDISHLYAHQEPPAFAARFCEIYDNAEERHD